MLRLVVLFFCVLGNFSVFCQKCTNCISLLDCPAAKSLLERNDKTSREILKNAFCAYDGNNPLVCCSSLTNRDISGHPNIQLLPSDCGLIPGDRIFGGKETGLYDYPWMALISYKTRFGNTFQCGGSVINSRYILTAAHCVVGRKLAGVRVGEHDISTDTDCVGVPPKIVCESRIQDFPIEEEITHKDYSRLPIVINDIALLRLKKPIDFKPKNARPLCLPVTSAQRSHVDATAVVAGWGKTENTDASNVLLSVRVPIHPKNDCTKAINRGTSDDYSFNKICAGEYSKDSCSGDSGGPLMIEGIHNGVERYIQRGIVSYGPVQCGSDSPGIYTDVTKYMDWILDNIKP